MRRNHSPTQLRATAHKQLERYSWSGGRGRDSDPSCIHRDKFSFSLAGYFEHITDGGSPSMRSAEGRPLPPTSHNRPWRREGNLRKRKDIQSTTGTERPWKAVVVLVN